MRIPRAPHAWSVGPERGVEIQRELAGRVRLERPQRRVRFVAGVDAAFTEDDVLCLAGAVVWDLQENVALEKRVAERKLLFPYVPGLLSFREAPAVLDALRRVRSPVDAILCDAHGLAHPRRFGLACHVGVLAGVPTVGCAKSLLVGEHRPLVAERGARVPLVHDGEVLGSVLRTRTGVRPVYVSVGHAIDLETAERLVLEAALRFRLPEPTRLADRLVANPARRASGSRPPAPPRERRRIRSR